MITTLEKAKTRLSIAPTDVTQDALLTQFIQSIAARFDSETGRTLERCVGFMQEFFASDLDVVLECYPLEQLTKVEVRGDITSAWVEITDAPPVLRQGCVLSFPRPLGMSLDTARITYTGGYVFPGAVPGPGQTALPADLEVAAIEQVAQMHQLRATAGVFRIETNVGTYWELGDRYWVPWVRGVLKRYRRLLL